MPTDVLEVFDPTTAGNEAPALSPRIPDLNGKVIGALWNGRPQEDEVLKGLLNRLSEQYQLKGIRFYRKPQLYISAPIPLVNKIVSEVDAMITGVGT
jgi:hypothetical protein